MNQYTMTFMGRRFYEAARLGRLPADGKESYNGERAVLAAKRVADLGYTGIEIIDYPCDSKRLDVHYDLDTPEGQLFHDIAMRLRSRRPVQLVSTILKKLRHNQQRTSNRGRTPC